MFLLKVIFLIAFFMILGFKKPGVGFIASLVTAIVWTVVSANTERWEIIIPAPVFFFVTLAAILLSRDDPDFERWPKILAKWILTIVVFLFLSVTACVLFGPAGFFGVALLVLFMFTIISYALTSRQATAVYVISTIGSSMRQNLPLTMALEMASGEERDVRSRTLRRIKKWLVQGYSLSESIRRGYPRCPGYAAAMMSAAEKIGQLPTAIQAIEADMVASTNERRKLRPVHPFYPVVLMTFMYFVVMGVMKYIIPIFSTVLEEMSEGVTLPAATRFMCNIARYGPGGFIFPILGIIIIVSIPLAIYIRFRPRRPGKPYLISRIFDFLKWHLPILHWFENNYSMVQMVELLRLSLNAGCTVNDAIANTLGLDVNNCFRKCVRRWLTRIEAGENISAAARESGLGSTIAWAFDGQINQGNTLSILGTLESFYRSNYSYGVNLARFIMWPCVTIAMGLTVGFVVYSIFSPMVAIINHLAAGVMP
jgi:type IV pilus assembly protein PilC